ncbi:MAG TPA: dienelactone hydrolase family protein [Candidatus Limnocylindria bacterium]|nr:dienelactone hydrolase family protein [Candidatus Limnocylindria bacterium]
MHAHDIGFEGNGAFLRAHLAVPDAGVGPGLVLVPDVRGLSDHYREVAGRFAREGFTTLVIDLYSREGMPELPDMNAVFRWMAALPDARILGDLAAAAEHLRRREECAGVVGIAGFCMGGQYALLAACTDATLRACVSWYGMLRYTQRTPHRPRSPLDLAEQLACPYLGLFGEEDALIPLADVDELRERLARAGKRFEIVTFPGCGHAFMNDTRPDAYRPAAAAESFRRATAFLHAHLNGQETPR